MKWLEQAVCLPVEFSAHQRYLPTRIMFFLEVSSDIFRHYKFRPYLNFLLEKQLRRVLLFEQRWPKFHKSKTMHCVSNFISHTNRNTFLFIKIHYFILIALTSRSLVTFCQNPNKRINSPVKAK